MEELSCSGKEYRTLWIPKFKRQIELQELFSVIGKGAASNWRERAFLGERITLHAVIGKRENWSYQFNPHSWELGTNIFPSL